MMGGGNSAWCAPHPVASHRGALIRPCFQHLVESRRSVRTEAKHKSEHLDKAEHLSGQTVGRHGVQAWVVHAFPSPSPIFPPFSFFFTPFPCSFFTVRLHIFVIFSIVAMGRGVGRMDKGGLGATRAPSSTWSVMQTSRHASLTTSSSFDHAFSTCRPAVQQS